MPVQRPHTGAPRTRTLVRGTTGGARPPSQGRVHVTHNRSGSAREVSGRPPRRACDGAEGTADAPSSPPAHLVYEDVQQQQQQTEHVLAALSNEERRIFHVMSALLVRQPLVQAHRVLACLAYQSETRRYLAQYGGVLGDTAAAKRDGQEEEPEDVEGKAALLRELEAYHVKATARLEAESARDAREAQRGEWVRSNLEHKRKKRQQSDAAHTREAIRSTSKGQHAAQARPVRRSGSSPSPAAASSRRRGAPPLTEVRTPSASSATPSQASMRSPLAKRRTSATPIADKQAELPQKLSPLEQTRTPQLDRTPLKGTHDDAADAAPAWSSAFAAQKYEPAVTLQTVFPLPTSAPPVAAAPSAPEPSVSVHSTAVDADEPYAEQHVASEENITRWLFTEHSAPATNAHPAGTAAAHSDDFFHMGGVPSHAKAAAEDVDEDEQFIPGAPLGAAVPMDEPLEAVPDTDDLKMPWDDI